MPREVSLTAEAGDKVRQHRVAVRMRSTVVDFDQSTHCDANVIYAFMQTVYVLTLIYALYERWSTLLPPPFQ